MSQTRQFTILRAVRGLNISDPFNGQLPFRGPFASPLAKILEAGPPELRVEVESLTHAQIRDVSRDPEVEAIAPVMPTKLIAPMDGPEALAAEAAWGIQAVLADKSSFDGDGIVVAVLDTGIDAAHPAFAGVQLVQNDFTGSGNGDIQGHGTHCAGTIFGRDVENKRIGVARGVKKAVIGKVLDNHGNGSSNWIFRAMQWALDEGANVISMSLGFDFPGMVQGYVHQGLPLEAATSVVLEAYRGNLRMFDAIMGLLRARLAFGSGTVVVAAAGNESNRPQYEIAASLPAAADGVIAVGALEKVPSGLAIAKFSNTHPQVSAPGVNIVSAKVGGGVRVLSGTSMAAPHVAGIAALWWQALRASQSPANSQQVIAKLLASARTEPLAANVDVADRGVGIVSAPTN